ncbi:MAG: hypothetical protein EBZ69_01865 [Alphaproteobacteria bacterium]|nr:hypothetical protein [Alphaproteobacteria bacterium]NDG05464.1 hypothetical protein [Alphaproteobacteria bacterium]
MTTKYKSDFMTVMHERGYVHQITDIERLDERAAKGPITAYVGYDPTADSLHVGNLVSIMMLRRLPVFQGEKFHPSAHR